MRPLAEVMQQLLSPVTFERRTERKVRVEEDAHPPRTASVGGNPTQGMGCHGSLTSVRWADSGDFRGAGPSGLGGQTALQPDGRPAGHMFQAVSSTGRPEGLWKAVCCDSGGILASESGGQIPKSRPHGPPRAPHDWPLAGVGGEAKGLRADGAWGIVADQEAEGRFPSRPESPGSPGDGPRPFHSQVMALVEAGPAKGHGQVCFSGDGQYSAGLDRGWTSRRWMGRNHRLAGVPPSPPVYERGRFRP